MATISAEEFFSAGPVTVVSDAGQKDALAAQESNQLGFFESFGRKIGGSVLDEVKGGAKQIGEAVKSAATMGNPLRAGLRIAGGAASIINAPVTGLIKSGIDAASGAISESKTVQKFSNTPTGQGISEIQKKAGDVIAKHPEAAQDIADLINVFSTVAGVEGMRGAVPKMKGVVTDTVEGVTRSASATQKVLEGWQSKNTFAKNVITDREAVGKILQGKPGDIEAGLNTLKEVPIEGVKNYKDLGAILEERAKNLTGNVDEVLGTDATPHTLNKLVSQQNVNGQSVKFNYVKQALTDLAELYTKTTSPQDVVRIKQLIKQGNTKGFTAKEVNDIAREYGTEFGKKAFNAKTGDPLTSVNAQSYENVRTGVKDTARGLMPDAGTKAIDKQITDTLNTKRLVDKMTERVNALEQKVNKRGVIEKLGRAIGQGVDIATMGGVRGFLQKFFPSNVGLKTLNSLDLESQLNKNLKIIQKALDAPTEEEMINILVNTE